MFGPSIRFALQCRSGISMTIPTHRVLISILLSLGLARHVSAQAKGTVAPTADAGAAQGIKLVEQGRCQQALPLLTKSTPRVIDKQLKYHAGMALAKCAMSLNQTETAAQALMSLQREFPKDPEVLYLSTHYFSELATRASEELAASAPNSYQAHELNAEALESQNRWDEATEEYKKILEQNPNVPGIHYRLARILLSKPATATTSEEAKSELNQELKIDPTNAAAEFTLGELARQDAQWDAAVEHFSRAAKLDVGFSEAYLAKGMSLVSAGKYSDAIAPLQTYVKMQPDDAAGHYQLGIAYSRTGQNDAAAREMERQRQLAEKPQTNTPR